ncbi:hypothetical protein NHX12_032738 [Muraenolepis orangiensis]|uniref:Reverse transcriptase domain-containing protein n=1 Tax=Muraenolepis orangiensis TaxID=630683 RepID=A0A9Q0D7B5_9TELE|nr:hypothetical protein NHX12_032738 [Muraenolepis orangiensis]
MVKFIMEMLSNRSFILRTSDGQRSRLRTLRNGVPQGSVLSPLLFNIYIHNLPETTSRQYGYADDLAIMLRRTTSAVEQGLNQDMGILAAYLRKWRLQLSTGKTVAAAYHLCNREAKRELSVSVDNKRLEHQLAPNYLGVRLDRTLSYKQHLEEVRAKVTARVSLIRRLAGTTWGASARTLRISTQALVFSAAEYCAPVWSRSPHVKKVDPIINNALRIITAQTSAMSKQAFPGNSNADSMVQYELQQRVVAHYVHLVPVDWNPSGRIGLRLEMYGCPYTVVDLIERNATVFSSVQLSVGAALSPQRSALSENFQGCVENLFYNDLNLIDLAVQKDRQVDMTVGSVTDLETKSLCSV